MFSGFKVYMVCWKLCVLKSHGRFKERRGTKRKGKALQICGVGLAMERGWNFQPADPAAAFVPIWDLLVNAFFWPGLVESAACCPFLVANSKVSQLTHPFIGTAVYKRKMETLE